MPALVTSSVQFAFGVFVVIDMHRWLNTISQLMVLVLSPFYFTLLSLRG